MGSASRGLFAATVRVESRSPTTAATVADHAAGPRGRIPPDLIAHQGVLSAGESEIEGFGVHAPEVVAAPSSVTTKPSSSAVSSVSSAEANLRPRPVA